MVTKKNSTDPATTPLKDYINFTITQIKDGLPPNTKIGGTIILEMSTISQEKTEGGFDIRVLNYGANISENVIQKMTIPVKIMYELDYAEEYAAINKSLFESVHYSKAYRGTPDDISLIRNQLEKDQ